MAFDGALQMSLQPVSTKKHEGKRLVGERELQTMTTRVGVNEIREIEISI